MAEGQPVCLWGDRGVGKSQIVAEIARRQGIALIDLRGALLDAVDLRGIPVPDMAAGVTRWLTPGFLPVNGTGIMFVDEITRAQTSVQNAHFQLILDRRLGDWEVPDGWSILAASNYAGAGVTPMADALRARFTHIDVMPDLKDWRMWAATSGKVDPMVIAFVSMRPELLNRPVKDERVSPNPRAWEFVSRIERSGVADAILAALVTGTVGDGAAVEYLAFRAANAAAINLDAILLHPDTADIPKTIGGLYVVSCGLSMRMDVSNVGRVFTYFDRLPVEYSVFAVRSAMTRAPVLQACPEFTHWAATHPEVF